MELAIGLLLFLAVAVLSWCALTAGRDKPAVPQPGVRSGKGLM
jgi:hypothetical protein